jgi:hypothetical protein
LLTVPQFWLTQVMSSRSRRALAALVAVAVACLAGSGAAAAATIGSLTPSQAKAGDPAFVLVVDGEGFTDGATGSRVLWNGSQRPTTWVSATV